MTSHVRALSCLASKSPVIVQCCYATNYEFIASPFLKQYPVVSRLNALLHLLPPPVILLDPNVTEGDGMGAPQDSIVNIFHTCNDSAFNKDGFCAKAYANNFRKINIEMITDQFDTFHNNYVFHN